MKKKLSLFVCYLIFASLLCAQTRHILHGYLLDEQGLPISGIKLEALQTMNMFSETDENGHFQFSLPDLGTEDLTVKILTKEYVLYDSQNHTRNDNNTVILPPEKQHDGLLNIFMIEAIKPMPSIARRGSSPQEGQAKSLYALRDQEKSNVYAVMPTNYTRPISLSEKTDRELAENKNKTIYSNIISTDTPILNFIEQYLVPMEPEENLSRGNMENIAGYEIQIAALSKENPKVKTYFEQLTGKEITIRTKNGHFVYVIVSTSLEDARDLVNQLSTPEMEKKGIIRPFLKILEGKASQNAPIVFENKVPSSPTRPKDLASVQPKTTATKPQYLIQLQASRFPMNSPSRRALEANLGKQGETLYEYSDVNADIKYRYYIARKFSTIAEAEGLRDKLSALGIGTLIVTDKMNVAF